MSIFKCKMCGGALEINNNETVATCEYCGTQQTLPKLDDEKRANLYDRANHFRRNNEFDKAMGIYEQILNEDNTDSEAYWSLVLCRYGIEYVEDPTTHKRVPTVNRAQFTSVYDDDNYKSALQYADGYQKSIYEEEAKAINEIQKGILAISQKEEPFDVFICYKETDNSGRRTHDSVLANDLYHQLTQEGFKVFFARITLEDKLGSAYEPYIFAALNSSKVMVVLGTKPEFFNAVWVKNEWSRYLALIKNGANKMLIPAYKDMDPYDLPEEFSHLQAQDMSKLGFMQDLIRGIKKIVKADEPKETVVKETVVTGGNANVAPLLERAFMFLEDGEWQSAEEYCEKVLDIDPKCAKAYLGKLMAELRVNTEDVLCDYAEPFDNYDNYIKAIRFADSALREKLEKDIEHINTRNENDRLEGIYIKATDVMNSAKTENEFKNAVNVFKTINDYKDSASLIVKCLDKAEIARKDAILANAKSKMSSEVISYLEEAIKLFESISGWKDADEQIIVCKNKIEEIKADDEAKRIEREIQKEKANRLKKKIIKISTLSISVVAVVLLITIPIYNKFLLPYITYKEAINLLEAGEYYTSLQTLKKLDNYKDSESYLQKVIEKVNETKVEEIKNYFAIGQRKECASSYFDLLNFNSTHKFVPSNTDEINELIYQLAVECFNNKEYTEARRIFRILKTDNYKNSNNYLLYCEGSLASSATTALEKFEKLPQDLFDVNERIAFLKNLIKLEGSYRSDPIQKDDITVENIVGQISVNTEENGNAEILLTITYTHNLFGDQDRTNNSSSLDVEYGQNIPIAQTSSLLTFVNGEFYYQFPSFMGLNDIKIKLKKVA
ncbi:MAG: TIR domain-containing protein [Clostridia bacterium]|nr:TIR domain-containing protein [Clostridia bacterium]